VRALSLSISLQKSQQKNEQLLQAIGQLRQLQMILRLNASVVPPKRLYSNY
jgi:hypothetical protein